ncbi:ABC transporter ATP-binding protein [Paracoccus aminophilus]|uniref:Peptide/nickel transport system, ATP-binding protein n=1 Tax=Paracoccus aminophilus JCM 7686 TaxID=1367847 RepID=S5YVX2_PARAH|nr:ABC transporter ATP-binding protein [Paracoccus aminophilus]AGT09396.1 peptide/nickel transport system, ATP-binding protein [Paracoccus aminophilus JCM 7686]
MSAPFAQIEALSVRYPGATRPALDRLSLTIAQGERLAVIGESGSGKSTFARALAGLLPQGSRQSGEIHWTPERPRPGAGYGYVFQDPGGSLNPVLSIGTQLVEVIRTHLRLSRAEARDRAEALLARVQLPDPQAALARYPHQFSGGQRQRIAIALAIAAGPALLIADEATSALDMLVQAEIMRLLDDLVREMGMTLIFITHDMALAASLADRIAVLRDARLVETGPARQVIDAPREPYTRELLAAHVDLRSPVLIGQTSGGRE